MTQSHRATATDLGALLQEDPPHCFPVTGAALTLGTGPVAGVSSSIPLSSSTSNAAGSPRAALQPSWVRVRRGRDGSGLRSTSLTLQCGDGSGLCPLRHQAAFVKREGAGAGAGSAPPCPLLPAGVCPGLPQACGVRAACGPTASLLALSRRLCEHKGPKDQSSRRSSAAGKGAVPGHPQAGLEAGGSCCLGPLVLGWGVWGESAEGRLS